MNIFIASSSTEAKILIVKIPNTNYYQLNELLKKYIREK